MDILFKNDDFVFSYRVGGILIHNEKILLQRPKNDDYTIIGGHVAAMETSMETLKRERGANVVVVTSMERTLVDCLDRPELAGGWEELWRSLVSAAFYDLDKVVTYAGRLENATTAAKVGFFLEQNQQALRVPDTVLNQLATLRPKQKHYIGPGRAPGKYLPRWNLIVPPPILEQAWGAVL